MSDGNLIAGRGTKFSSVAADTAKVELHSSGDELHIVIPTGNVDETIDLSDIDVSSYGDVHVHSTQNLAGPRMILTPSNARSTQGEPAQNVYVHGYPSSLAKIFENKEGEIVGIDPSLPSNRVNISVVAQSGAVTLKDFSPVFWQNSNVDSFNETLQKVPTNFAVFYSNDNVTINSDNSGVNMYVPKGNISSENMTKLHQEFATNGLPAADNAAEINGFLESYDDISEGLQNSGVKNLVINGSSKDIAIAYGNEAKINAGTIVTEFNLPDDATRAQVRWNWTITGEGVVQPASGESFVFVGENVREASGPLRDAGDYDGLRALAIGDADSAVVDFSGAERFYFAGDDSFAFDRKIEQMLEDQERAMEEGQARAPRSNDRDKDGKKTGERGGADEQDADKGLTAQEAAAAVAAVESLDKPAASR